MLWGVAAALDESWVKRRSREVSFEETALVVRSLRVAVEAPWALSLFWENTVVSWPGVGTCTELMFLDQKKALSLKASIALD